MQHFISPTVQNHHKKWCDAGSFKDNTKFHKFRIMRSVMQHFISPTVQNHHKKWCGVGSFKDNTKFHETNLE
jgi:hypothetical protein